MTLGWHVAAKVYLSSPQGTEAAAAAANCLIRLYSFCNHAGASTHKSSFSPSMKLANSRFRRGLYLVANDADKTTGDRASENFVRETER
jgi:hypothetical protein